MIKAWEEFCSNSLKEGKIKHRIIDKPHLHLYIRFCSERPKRNRNGMEIPGTFIGASHIKKLFLAPFESEKNKKRMIRLFRDFGLLLTTVHSLERGERLRLAGLFSLF
ncbi:hypothetical protein GALMADRAFT_148552 [Galerina marginata CBS 339.88]|uniref:Uncharacterized protein n=1 Tax=Galerina marginata (strain CBS 339.88) TaxID=685588 RepID=A0A067SD19_GALM3|nr:hypothetical protein GALMADRAFT_148552 [Galerina marginata CBS 339.88]